ncbi:hypothetical protein [Haliangium sp.]|uniref:hypothetical protein n=1 Tax=Haliangium sp. TaxID=2663208 RepID=UPI003D0FD58C
MSPPADRRRLSLRLPWDGAAQMTVYDGFDRVVLGPVEEDTEAELPAGLYTVRTQRAGDVRDQIVRLNEDRELSVTPPAHASAAPLTGAVTSHEYYTGPCVTYSQTQTAFPIVAPGGLVKPNSGLMLFVRAHDRKRYDGGPLARDLSLYGPGGAEPITRLDGNDVAVDDDTGWLAYSVLAAPGQYRLRGYHAEVWRELSIHVFERWQTQVFIRYDGPSGQGRPRLDTLTMLLSPMGAGFNPSDESVHAADLALQCLRSPIDWVPGSEMRVLLAEKFGNPMLGLLGAHLLLRRQERRSPGERKPELIDEVLGNLRGLLGPTPDVLALQCRAARLFDRRLDQLDPIFDTPMLYDGAVAVIEAAALDERLVPEDGDLARYAPVLLSDLPWTSWEVPAPASAEPVEPAEVPEPATSAEVPKPAARAPGRDLVDTITSDLETFPQYPFSGVQPSVDGDDAVPVPDADSGIQPQGPHLGPRENSVTFSIKSLETSAPPQPAAEQAAPTPTPEPGPPPAPALDAWVAKAIDDALAAAGPRPKGGRADLAPELARMLGLPQSTIRRALKRRDD